MSDPRSQATGAATFDIGLNRATARPLVRIAALAALIAPISVLLHELAHILVASGLGYETRLSYRGITLDPFAASPGPIDATLIAAAGPASTLLLGLLMFAGGRALKAHATLSALGVAFLCRFARIPVYLASAPICTATQRLCFSPGGDEHTLAIALGAPLAIIVAVELALVLAILSGIYASLPNSRRTALMLASFVGGVAGLLLWMEALGPLVLPIALV